MTNKFFSFANRANTPPVGFKHASRIVWVLVLMLTLGVGQMWGKAGDKLYECTFPVSTAQSYTMNYSFTRENKSWTASVAQINGSVFYLGCNSTHTSKGVLVGTGNTNPNNNGAWDDVISAWEDADSKYGTTVHAYALRFDNAYNNVGEVTFAWDGGNNAFCVFLFGDKGSGLELLDSTYYATSGTSVSGSVTWKGTTSNFSSFAIVARPGTKTTNATQKTLRAKTFTIKEGATTPSYTINAQSNNTTYGTVSLDGSVITGSPKSGYRYASPAYSVSPDNSATVSQNGDEFTVTPSANTTITINFEAIPKYKVSFNTGTGNPTQDDITETTAGAGITLPNGPTPRCSGDGWEFAGWAAASVASETSTAPRLLASGTIYKPTSNATLYAVYKKGTSVSNNYVKVTSSAGIVSGCNYVIARGTTIALDANEYIMDNGDGYFATSAISVSDNTISSPTADQIWQVLGDNTNGYSIYNSNRHLYIGYDSDLHDLFADNTLHTDYKFSYTNSNVYVQSKSETSYYFSTYQYNTNNGKQYFFEIGSSAYVVLYRQQGTYSYLSNPNCCTPLGTINGSFLRYHFFDHFWPFWTNQQISVYFSSSYHYVKGHSYRFYSADKVHYCLLFQMLFRSVQCSRAIAIARCNFSANIRLSGNCV